MINLDLSEDAVDLFIRLRGVYRFFMPERACALSGFIAGFSVAKGLQVGAFQRNIQGWVEGFLSPAEAGEWHELVSRSCPSSRCEIPMVYAAHDHMNNIVYSDGISCVTTEGARIEFWENQIKVSGRDSIAPPHKLVLVRGKFDSHHLFFLGSDGKRFFEASMGSAEKLKAWAHEMLKVDTSAWKTEDPGAFV